MFKSLIFTPPFGTALSPAESYAYVSARLLKEARVIPLHNLPAHGPLAYMLGSFSSRGCLWYDGQSFGSTFQDDSRFLPQFKSRYRGVAPFIIEGFVLPIDLTDYGSFVACDLAVWRGRFLGNVRFDRKDALLKDTLAHLVDNQPPRFLRDERVRLPTFLALPRLYPHRQRLLEASAPLDFYVCDFSRPWWRVWCPNWIDR